MRLQVNEKTYLVILGKRFDTALGKAAQGPHTRKKKVLPDDNLQLGHEPRNRYVCKFRRSVGKEV